jgi:TPR repeat protein
MRNQWFAAIAVIGGGMLCTDPAMAQEPAAALLVACDRLAGSPYDPNRDGPGVVFEKIDTKAAIDTCGRALASNPDHPRMLLNLGRAYDRAGQFAEGLRFYRRAVDQGYAAAQLALGTTYANGNKTVVEDDREAVRLFKLAADQGNAMAETNLAIFYMQGGGGLEKDEHEAARLVGLAADQGLPVAQDLLGSLYANGDGGLTKNEARAVQLFKFAADQGEASAQHDLGVAYRTGHLGLPRDAREAVRLFKLSADQGYAPSQYDLGVLFMNGTDGLPQDDREAGRLFKLAADQGYAAAQNNLGVFYRHGRGGLPQDESEAVRLFRLAAEQGNEPAKHDLSRTPDWGIELPVAAVLIALVGVAIAALELLSRRGSTTRPGEPTWRHYRAFRAFYLIPSGRIARRQYWLEWAIPVTVIILAFRVAHVAGIRGGSPELAAAIGGASFGFNLLISWAGAAVLAKRIHDRNKTGWLAGCPVLCPGRSLYGRGEISGGRGSERAQPADGRDRAAWTGDFSLLCRRVRLFSRNSRAEPLWARPCAPRGSGRSRTSGLSFSSASAGSVGMQRDVHRRTSVSARRRRGVRFPAAKTRTRIEVLAPHLKRTFREHTCFSSCLPRRRSRTFR